MSRFCKATPDEARSYVHADINGNPFPPMFFDFSKHATYAPISPDNRLEYPELAFKGVLSETTLVPEDEPVKRDDELWKRICQEEQAIKNTQPIVRKHTEEFSQETPEGKYVGEKVLPVLQTALRATLVKMKTLGVGKRERNAFDPIDYVAEYLWNFNPRHPKRESNYKTFYEIPEFRKWLLRNPRPDWPRHWHWNRVDAVVCIQRNVRGWLVRKTVEVQQLRHFWKVLKGKAEPTQEQTRELTLGQIVDAEGGKNPNLKIPPLEKKQE